MTQLDSHLLDDAEGLSMTSKGESSAQLPVEIWRNIAGHMSSKCWARVNRTCKAMYSVQPEQIDIYVRSQSALAWMQTHWGQASTLKLSWMKADIPWVMAHNAASVTSLKRLELCLQEEKSPTTAMLLTWLLAQAPQLQLLNVQHPTALVVPPIRNLSHLIMASTEFTPTTAASIRQLRNLQTLWLGTRNGLREKSVSAEFDLASLPHLTDVCIARVPVPGMTFPKNCRLHLVGDEEHMYLDTWEVFVSQRQLHSINLHSSLPDNPYPDDIADTLRWFKCTFLRWGFTQLGEPADPMLFDAKSFCCLTHLYLVGGEMYIELHHELPLQVLRVEARLLSIVILKPKEQAKRLQQVRVRYRSLEGTDAFALVGAMCNMGAMVSKVDVEEPGWRSTGRYNGFLVSYEPVPDVWKCPCGACLDCVRQVLEC